MKINEENLLKMGCVKYPSNVYKLNIGSCIVDFEQSNITIWTLKYKNKLFYINNLVDCFDVLKNCGYKDGIEDAFNKIKTNLMDHNRFLNATNKEIVANYIAKAQYSADKGAEKIFYLPENSPENEIRLLQVNNLICETLPIKPFEFCHDENWLISIIDVTPHQWGLIQKMELSLPFGWIFYNYKEFNK